MSLETHLVKYMMNIHSGKGVSKWDLAWESHIGIHVTRIQLGLSDSLDSITYATLIFFLFPFGKDCFVIQDTTLMKYVGVVTFKSRETFWC